jgi:hypothetical protein
MRVVVVVAATLAINAARADVPQALSTERTDLLDGRIAVALVEGSEVEGGEIVRADWGDTRLTVVAQDLGTARLADIRERIAREVRADGEIVARIAPVPLARPNLGYSVRIGAPRTVEGRELVYAAFIVDRSGRLYELAFFVSQTDELEGWSDVAARIAATTVIRTVDAKPRALPQGTCAVQPDLVFAPYPVTTLEVFPVHAGTLYGRATGWSVWLDGSGYHAEAIAGDAHVICSAATREGLERSRRAISY